MNTIMVIVLKVLFPYGLCLSHIPIHSIIFRNGPTNVNNSGKGVSVPCRVPPLPPRRGLGRDTTSVFVIENSSGSSSVNDVKWHARLGHIGQDCLKRLAKAGLLGSIDKIDLSVCEQCLVGKATRLPFGKAKRPCFPLELIHSDICGPECEGKIWNDFTRFGHVYLISHRSEALDCFKRYSTLVENKLNTKIKSLWTNRGHEYLYDLFKAYCDEKGIARQLTIPYMPQQNDVVERRNRTLLDMVRSMMAQATLPISFWGDALMTTTYILNRVPSKSIPSTSYEVRKGATLDLNVMRL